MNNILIESCTDIAYHFLQMSKGNSAGKGNLSTNCAGMLWISYWKNNKILSFIKINSKQMIALNMRAKNIKPQEKNLRENLCNFWV